MSKKTYSSGNPDSKSDFYVEYIPSKSGGIKLDIQSKSKILHGSKLVWITNSVLSDLGIIHGKIYVIDNGKVLETGNHNNLLKNKGLYSKLYKLQFSQQKDFGNKVIKFTAATGSYTA